MKGEVNPAVFWGIIGVLVVGVVVFMVMRNGGSTFKPETGGSEAAQKKLQQTGQFYTPPPGAPVPRPGGGMAQPGGGTPGR